MVTCNDIWVMTASLLNNELGSVGTDGVLWCHCCLKVYAKKMFK